MANTLKFKSAEELQEKIDGFDTWLKNNKYPYKTVTRLAQYLDTTRQTLINYQDEIQDSIEDEEAKKIRHVLLHAKLELEADEHDRLYDRNMSRGAEFSLKNNHSWTDRTDVGISGASEIKLSSDLKEYAK